MSGIQVCIRALYTPDSPDRMVKVQHCAPTNSTSSLQRVVSLFKARGREERRRNNPPPSFCFQELYSTFLSLSRVCFLPFCYPTALSLPSLPLTLFSFPSSFFPPCFISYVFSVSAASHTGVTQRPRMAKPILLILPLTV